MKQLNLFVVLKTVLQHSNLAAHSSIMKRSIIQTSEIYFHVVPIQSSLLTNDDVQTEESAVSESLNWPMASLVLATSKHADFASSSWLSWASAPHDLLLVAEVDIKLKLCWIFL